MVEQNVKTPLVIFPQGSEIISQSPRYSHAATAPRPRHGTHRKPQMLDVMRINKRHYGVIAVGEAMTLF